LKPYSCDVAERLTARHELSMRLASSQPFAPRLLDVGCANGWFEFLCAGRLESAVSAIDVEPALVEAAKRNAPHADYAVGSVFSLPFPDATFDGAVMFEVIEHVPRHSEVAALKEVRRVLKPGGWLVLSTPYAHPISSLLDPAWYFGHRHYSRERIVSLMAAAGFRTNGSIVRGGLWELGGNISLYAFKWLLRSEPPLKGLFERHRTREFLAERAGICNIFVQAVAD
jgi:SAM-dependent methyltransferase